MHVFILRFNPWQPLICQGVLGFWIIKRHIIPPNILQFLVPAIEICFVYRISNIITHFLLHPPMNCGTIRCTAVFRRCSSD